MVWIAEPLDRPFARPVEQPDTRVSGVSAPSSPLDGITSVGAYSTRRLYTAYEGDCLLLRRSSDSEEQAFGFDANGDLDTAAISAWAGEDTLYVKTWYDQSGGGNDVTQTTAELQPELVLSAVNGLAALRFVVHRLEGPDTPFDSFADAGQFVAAVVMPQSANRMSIFTKGPYRPGLKMDTLHITYANATSSLALVSDAQLTIGEFSIVGYTAAVPDGSGNGVVTVHVGGEADKSDTVVIGTMNNAYGLTVGNGSLIDPSNNFNGDIAELVLCTPPPSEAARAAVFASQAAAYSLTVPNP